MEVRTGECVECPSQGAELRGQEILTQHLSLRPINLCDEGAVAAVCRIFREPATWTHLPAARPADDDSVRQYLAGHVRSWHESGLGWWFISVRQPPFGDEVIGIGGCALTRPDIQAWNLGYRLSPAVWGHGYATEVARAGLGAAVILSELPVTARVLERNPASYRVLDKLGLRLVWQGDVISDDPLTGGLARRIYADRELEPGLLDQLIRLG